VLGALVRHMAGQKRGFVHSTASPVGSTPCRTGRVSPFGLFYLQFVEAKRALPGEYIFSRRGCTGSRLALAAGAAMAAKEERATQRSRRFRFVMEKMLLREHGWCPAVQEFRGVLVGLVCRCENPARRRRFAFAFDRRWRWRWSAGEQVDSGASLRGMKGRNSSASEQIRQDGCHGEVERVVGGRGGSFDQLKGR